MLFSRSSSAQNLKKYFPLSKISKILINKILIKNNSLVSKPSKKLPAAKKLINISISISSLSKKGK